MHVAGVSWVKFCHPTIPSPHRCILPPCGTHVCNVGASCGQIMAKKVPHAHNQICVTVKQMHRVAMPIVACPCMPMPCLLHPPTPMMWSLCLVSVLLLHHCTTHSNGCLHGAVQLHQWAGATPPIDLCACHIGRQLCTQILLSEMYLFGRPAGRFCRRSFNNSGDIFGFRTALAQSQPNDRRYVQEQKCCWPKYECTPCHLSSPRPPSPESPECC